MSKHKIVIDARMINSSGIGTYLKNIISLLPQELNLTLLGKPDELRSIGRKAEIVKFPSHIYSLREQLAFPNIVPKCDVFWSPHYNVPLLPIKAKKRIVTIHDVYHLAFYETLPLKQKIYAKLLINQAVMRSDKILTVSNFSKNEILRFTNCKPEKISVIHNGVNKVLLNKDQTRLIEKYSLPEKYVLFVGNVKPHKNLSSLLEAYLLLNSSVQETYKIVIAGKKEGFITGDKRIYEKIQNNPILKRNVVMTGFVDDDDMAGIYSSASLFVFPSLYEGFGIPPIEAMCYECPTIVANIPSLREICGTASIYINPLDASDLAEKINRVLNNPKLKDFLIVQGKDKIKEYNWKEAALDIETVITQLV